MQPVPEFTERVKMRRRRTIAIVSAACAVVIAIIIGYAVSPARRSAPHPQPLTTASPHIIGGLPEYQYGTRLTRVETVTAAHPEVRITWTPPNQGGLIFAACIIRTDVTVAISSQLDDQSSGGDCQKNSTGTGRRPQPATGGPHTLTVKVTGTTDRAGRQVPAPADFALILGLADNVDWSAYVFPPRPAQLPALATFGDLPDLTSDPADPMRPRHLTFTWPGRGQLLADGTGPTRLRITVNGTRLPTFTKWGYDEQHAPLWIDPQQLPDLQIGDPARLTVTPEYADGPWSVDLA
jgi:hypothetical protein